MAHVTTNTTASGHSYTVKWRDRGKFRQRTFLNKRNAERFRERVSTEVRDGRITDPYAARGKTVTDVIEEVMVKVRLSLKPRAVKSYDDGYRLYIVPRFGARRVAEVTGADVQDWVTWLSNEKHLSPATCRNQFVALNKAFKHAVVNHYIAQNPCTGTELPTVAHADKFDPVYLTAHQVEALAAEIDAAAARADRDTPYGLLIRTAAYTGLRAGELAGLRIRDVNLMRREIDVVRTLQRIAGEWVVGAPKSERSTRTVPILNAALLPDLTAYLAQHPHRADPDALLWPGETHRPRRTDYDRPLNTGDVLRWHMRPALAAAGLPTGMRFHDLRHTYASLAITAGIDIQVVSRSMGHANITTTDTIYTRLIRPDFSAQADLFTAFVARDSAPPTAPAAVVPITAT